MAKGSMTTNSTVDLIDKTLSTENAPADAKAVGDYILDRTKETPEAIFYSKAAADELLARKFDLTGGTMSGELIFLNSYCGSLLGGSDLASPQPGDSLANLVIKSWGGVSFTTDCPDQTYTGKTAVGVDCRGGIVSANRFRGPADNGVVASGSNYVRFGDGTQICWGAVSFPALTANGMTGVNVGFQAPFANTDYVMVSTQMGDSGNTDGTAVRNVVRYTTGADLYVFNNRPATPPAGTVYGWIAIGRWK